MTETTLITLSKLGFDIANLLYKAIPRGNIYIHRSVNIQIDQKNVKTFNKLDNLVALLWNKQKKIVFLAPVGMVVRAITPYLIHKTVDPAIVVVDVYGRWAISLLSGHEGGANDLAFEIANIIGAEPIVTTTTEAKKNIIIGIGCRLNSPKEHIITAIHKALSMIDLTIDCVRLLASADVKSKEIGLHDAAKYLHLPIRFISSDTICNSCVKFTYSRVAKKYMNLPGVAEPSAILAGHRTKILLPRTVINGVTIAIAKENSSNILL